MKYKYDDKDLYRKQILKEDTDLWSDKDLLKEAVKQANEMNRRLSRIEKNFPRSEIVKNTKRQPDPNDYVKDGKVDRSALSNILNEAYRFNKNPTTLMKGFRKQLASSVKNFNAKLRYQNEEGEWVTPRTITSKNVWDLYDFLDEYREYWKNQEIPASDEVVDIFVESRRLHMAQSSLIRNMNFWRQHRDEMEELTPVKGSQPIPSSIYENMLQRK